MPSNSATASNPPKIAIIGGGLGGLTLLLTLYRRGVKATVYERDTHFSARAHLGGSLDLGWDNGQRALRENGLEDEFTKNSRPEGEELKIYDGSGNVLMHVGGNEDGPDEGAPKQKDPKKSRPEIDRSVLRKILLDACPPESVVWDHALAHARLLPDGQYELTFANGATVVCDILIGADGASSRVRPLVSPATPSYTGVTGVEISLAPSVAASPELADIVQEIGQGSTFGMQNGKVLGSQRNGDGRIRTYAWFLAPEGFTIPSDPIEVRRTLLEMYEGWAPWMLKLIEHCDDAAIYPRPVYILPVGHKWDHVNGVTVIGDAAHLMSPFSGAGANLAMLDGLELGLALSKLAVEGKLDDGEAREAAIKAFEENMCVMAGRVAGIAQQNLEACVHPDTPHSVIARFKALVSKQTPREG